jgi:hypothetical protein
MHQGEERKQEILAPIKENSDSILAFKASSFACFGTQISARIGLNSLKSKLIFINTKYNQRYVIVNYSSRLRLRLRLNYKNYRKKCLGKNASNSIKLILI